MEVQEHNVPRGALFTAKKVLFVEITYNTLNDKLLYCLT